MRSARKATAGSLTRTSAANDFRLVTRPMQDNATQRWVVMPVGDGSSTIRQLSNLRFVDARESPAKTSVWSPALPRTTIRNVGSSPT